MFREGHVQKIYISSSGNVSVKAVRADTAEISARRRQTDGQTDRRIFGFIVEDIDNTFTPQVIGNHRKYFPNITLPSHVRNVLREKFRVFVVL